MLCCIRDAGQPTVWRRTVTASERVQVGATDAAVGNLDVNVGLFEGFGLILLPHHFACGMESVLVASMTLMPASYL